MTTGVFLYLFPGWDRVRMPSRRGQQPADFVFEKGVPELIRLSTQLAADDWFAVGAGNYDNNRKDNLLVRQKSTGMPGCCVSGDTSQRVEMGRGIGMKWTVIA